MTAAEPRVDADPAAMWAPALARGLIRDEDMRAMRYRNGYIDLLPSSERDRHGLAQRTRRSLMCALLRAGGFSVPVVRALVGVSLRLDGDERVLNVACGPGRDTAFLAGQLQGSGFVIAVDSSASMMRCAVRASSGPRAVYMRADTHRLPFSDESFDVVSCLAGLHLSAKPMVVLQDMVRVLSPGGRIVVSTSCGGQSALSRRAIKLAATVCGVRVFDATTIPAFLKTAGMTDIEQHFRGMSQFITARRPARSQFTHGRSIRSTVRSLR
ncbi:class I SAM-dependent methyltransferase [Mycobacterium sp. NPDC048908]|uniref:class I SAM-dependent methyltransferase n=1 Tax=Mycobacterium sp. NPDC048908 TaxID=3364292 RepID=UPI00371264DC